MDEFNFSWPKPVSHFLFMKAATALKQAIMLQLALLKKVIGKAYLDIYFCPVVQNVW